MRAQGQPKQLKQDSFFRYIAATLPYMRTVKEIILLDPNVDQSAATARDLLEGNTDMQLETLWCDLEALLAKCWASLCSGRTLIKLQDFRGFCDPHQPPPERIAPPISPELKYFETSAHFAMRLPISWHITHLSIHVQWGELPLILKKISTLPGLSDQLHALRLNCYTRKEGAEQPAGSTATTPKRRISPLAVQWPRIVCRNLTAGVLNYLEIKEVTPYDGASGPVFPNGPRMKNGSDTPALRRIAWRPAWNEDFSRQSGKEIKAIALDIDAAGPWRVFARDDRSGRIGVAERAHAVNELSWKVTEWEDAKGTRRWHWPPSSRLYAQEATTS